MLLAGIYSSLRWLCGGSRWRGLWYFPPQEHTTNSRSIETETKFPPKSLENAPNSPTQPTVGPAPINAETTTLKWPPTHKNQRDLTYGPYNRYAPTCCFNKSVLTIDHGQNVVNQKTLARHEEVANNNVSYHKFYCLRRGPRTNIATMVVWVNAELFQNVLCGLIYRFRPRSCPPSPSLRQRKQNKTNL